MKTKFVFRRKIATIDVFMHSSFYYYYYLNMTIVNNECRKFHFK